MYKKIILFVKREGLLAFILKALDFLLKPFGISLLSFMNLKDFDLEKNIYTEKYSDNKKIFSEIYKNYYWKSKESLSGSGSDFKITKKYSKNLNKFCKNYKIKSFFDIPCGDFLFMNEFLKNKNISYTGGDIVEELIEVNQKKFSKYRFIYFDITNDRIDDYFDLLHVKDCLFHFSFDDIEKTLKNIINFKVKYILISNHKSLFLRNINIKTGKFRYLDLEKKPYFFPKPITKIKDYNFGNFPKYVEVWKAEDLKNHFKK